MKTKRFFSVLACAAFAVAIFSSCGKDEPTQETGISLPARTRVDQGSMITLRATSIPSGEVTTVEKWESLDKSVATVADDGVVTGVMIGTTTIKATKGEFTAECEVTVAESPEASKEGSDYYVIVMEQVTYGDLDDLHKIVRDLRVYGASGAPNRAWDVWNATFTGGTNTGLGFFSVPDEGRGRWYNLIKTDAANWAGGGVSIMNDPQSIGDNFVDMTDIAAHRNDYVLHIGLKTEHTFDILIRFKDGITSETAAGFVIGKQRVINDDHSYSNIVGDFPRDGAWHKIEIPFSKFPAGFYETPFQGGDKGELNKTPYVFELIVGDVPTGTQIEFDAVFFYKPQKK
jgi:hypothetical protein